MSCCLARDFPFLSLREPPSHKLAQKGIRLLAKGKIAALHLNFFQPDKPPCITYRMSLEKIAALQAHAKAFSRDVACEIFWEQIQQTCADEADFQALQRSFSSLVPFDQHNLIEEGEAQATLTYDNGKKISSKELTSALYGLFADCVGMTRGDPMRTESFRKACDTPDSGHKAFYFTSDCKQES